MPLGAGIFSRGTGTDPRSCSQVILLHDRPLHFTTLP